MIYFTYLESTAIFLSIRKIIRKRKVKILGKEKLNRRNIVNTLSKYPNENVPGGLPGW